MRQALVFVPGSPHVAAHSRRYQWTSSFEDAHTRAAVIKGGSNYQPQEGAYTLQPALGHFYFPQARNLSTHQKVNPTKPRPQTLRATWRSPCALALRYYCWPR